MPTITNAKRPRAYSYLRFSRPEQMKGDSRRRQTALAEAYAVEHGLELDDKLTYQDLGVSAFRGRNAAEGRLGDFLDAVKAGEVPEGAYLLVESLDRLSRDTARKALRTLEDIVDQGVTVVTLSDRKAYTAKNLTDDPMSLLMSLLVFMRAHEESQMKSQRLRTRWEDKRAGAHSKPMTARTPAWIELIEGELRADRTKAAVVRRVFALSTKGVGQEAIARKLNEDGVSTFGKAGHWQRSYVAKLLGNPAVVGDLTPHRVEYVDGKKRREPLDTVRDYFPSVIDRATFDALQKPPAEGQGRRPGGAKITSIVAGLAKCPLCGAAMTRTVKGAKGGDPKLVCTKAKVGAGCQYHAVKLPMVETAIRDAIDYIVGTVPAGDEALDKDISGTEEALSDLRGMAGRLADAVAKGNDSATVRRRLAEVEGEIARLEEEERRLRARFAEASPAYLERRLGELEAAAKGKDKARLNAALRALFSTVTVDHRQGSLFLAWRHGGETRIHYDVVVPKE